MKRVKFFRQVLFGSLGMGTLATNPFHQQPIAGDVSNSVGHIKTSLNAYSFNQYFRSGQMGNVPRFV